MTTEKHEVAKDTFLNLDWDPTDRHWSIVGDLRARNSGLSDDANYACEEALKPLFPRIEFDPETSCFFAYAKDREHAIVLVEAIEGWLVSHRAGWEAARREEDDELS